MLIKVVEGLFNADGDTLEPRGREVWAAKVNDFEASALHAAGTQVDPGTWYELDQFKSLVQSADAAGETEVFSTVSTQQSGVAGPSVAMIEIAEATAALMVCRSVIQHVEQLRKDDDIWIRVD